MASPNSAGEDDEHIAIDPAQPLKGIIICCTSIPPEHRTALDKKVVELGGVHKYDLTPDVTHLVVGDYDTPKYRHVARERPDIKAMDAAWIDALTELWKNDDEMDFQKLEKEYTLKPLEKRGINPSVQQGDTTAREPLLICLTGFGDQREAIAGKIVSNGGRYTGDLTRKCSHLIVNKPEGKKYTAAKSWNIYAVSLEWLEQSIARGLILEEAKFDPLLPPEEQGQGAWVKKDIGRASLGKRSRSAIFNGGGDGGPRKLRKTASMKLNSQRNNIWGDILGRSTSREYSFASEHQSEVETKEAPKLPAPVIQPQDEGVFSNCYFYIHGFTEQRSTVLQQTITTLGGTVCASIEEAATMPASKEPAHRFLIVPQTSPPETHPSVQHDNISVVTEYYIEKCLHHKQFFDPNEHVLGRPFPLFPIPGFSDLIICKAAFTGIELNQVARSVIQLGAIFEEEFHKKTSVLVCKSLAGVRKEKVQLAIKWGVPVVSADWLWECISTGYKVPIENFVCNELKLISKSAKVPPGGLIPAKKKNPEPESRSPKPMISEPLPPAGVDTSGFDHEPPENPKQRTGRDVSKQGFTAVSADFVTARTHPGESFDDDYDPSLTEVSSAHLNESPPPERRILPPRTKSKLANRPSSADTDQRPLSRTSNSSKSKDDPQEEALDQASKAAERQALSSKLSSLISSAEAPSNASAPRPRRRQLFGRAISNASNASNGSSASIDHIATKSAPESFREGCGEFGTERDADAAAVKDVADADPPSTQLGYRDPEAQEYKAAVMSRMMGGSAEVKGSSADVEEGIPVVGGRSLRRR